MVIELIQQWQGSDLGFRIAVLTSVAASYGLFEFFLASSKLRRSRAH